MTYLDEEREGDYLELYNPSSLDLDLSGFIISDGSHDMKLPEGTVLSGGKYLVIFTSEGSDAVGLGEGDTVSLSDAAGKLISELQIPEISGGLVLAHNMMTGEMEVTVPSPGRGYTTLSLSAESGYYDEGFSLYVNSGEAKVTLRYTTDGSAPDISSREYRDGIEVSDPSDRPGVYRLTQNVVPLWEEYVPEVENEDKVFIVRVAAFDEGGVKIGETAGTYLIGKDEYKNSGEDEAEEGGNTFRYVLSLIADPEDLFGDAGIYVTGAEYDKWYTSGQIGEAPEMSMYRTGRESEISAYLQLFGDDLLMDQSVGMRIQGASNRSRVNKRFSLYARKEYSGDRYFAYELFDCKSHALLLREDFADAFLQHIVSDLGIGGMGAVPATVFLDGEYWYDTYIREKYNEDYLEAHYGVDRNDVTILEAIPDEIYEYIDTHDMSQESSYEELNQIMDIENYITFLSANIYLNNVDFSEEKNLRCWKSFGLGDDQRWKFLIYDMDAVTWVSSEVYDGYNAVTLDTFTAPRIYIGNTTYETDRIFAALRENRIFCEKFVTRFMDLSNTTFERNHVSQQLQKWGENRLWNGSFFDNRMIYIAQGLADEFALSGQMRKVTVAVSDEGAGQITVNTVTPEFIEGSWSGYYFEDYAVMLTAEAEEGYIFAYWTDGTRQIEGETITFYPDKNNNLWTAVFERR